MRVYVAMVQDRHTDVDAQVFSTPESAKEYARNVAVSLGGGEPLEERHDMEGWDYYARYGEEGDCVWVFPREVR